MDMLGDPVLRGKLIDRAIKYLRLAREDNTLTRTKEYVLEQLGLETDQLDNLIKGR